MKPTTSTLIAFIRNKTEGGRELKKAGLEKSIAANDGHLFVPEYDVRCFIAQTLLAQKKREYYIRETVTVGKKKISDRTYLPAMIAAEVAIPDRPHGVDRFHTPYDGERAQSAYEQFTKDLDGQVNAFCKNNNIIRCDGLGIFSPPKKNLDSFEENPYPYIISERQLSTTAKRTQLLSTLGIRGDVGIREVSDDYSGFERTYSRSEFLETRTERLKLRWSGDAGFQYAFRVCGIPTS